MSSFPIGGVTGGILGALVVSVGICAFAWYKVKTHLKNNERSLNQDGGSFVNVEAARAKSAMEQSSEDPIAKRQSFTVPDPHRSSSGWPDT